ncbi:MAG TPA: jacalin-like lectin [Allosphingosinicella sp.]|nr:jacalin-like lectin [Allosphingosinicella sp.]
MATQVMKAKAFGGNGGSPFDDLQASGGAVASVNEIVVRSGKFVDNISTTYGLPNGGTFVGTHGGNGGQASTITLAAGEKVVGVKGRSGSRLDQITFVTLGPDGRKVHGPFGGSGGSPFEIEAEIDSFYGRSGTLEDRLGFFVNVNTTGLHGGTGGTAFADPVPVPGQTFIKQIVIRSGSLIDSISTTYINPDGTTTVATHGGGGGQPTTIVFNPGETITAVTGRSGKFVDSLTILTSDRRVFGPFGGTGGTPFVVNANILGFVGRSGTLIDSIGFFTS